MWSVVNGKTRLDISSVRKEFKVVSDRGMHLVHPKKDMWDWLENERWLRSIVVNDEGEILSCSWPKFGNYGEFLEDSEKLERALENGSNVQFSHKEDGTVAIRSVINGKVIFRTRGTLYGETSYDGGHETFSIKFRNVALNKYPMLLDPDWMSNRTLLFEYVSPSNRIVVGYRTEDLIFLGMIYHNCTISTWTDTEKVAEEGRLNLVKHYSLPNNIEELLNTIEAWKSEGIVARCNDGKVLVKIKSAWYLVRHRIKSKLNYEEVVQFVELFKINNINEFKEKFSAHKDCDFEILIEAEKFYYRYLLALKFSEDCLNEAKAAFKEFTYNESLDDKANRKNFALNYASKQNPFIRKMMFDIYSKDEDALSLYCRKIILSEANVKYEKNKLRSK